VAVATGSAAAAKQEGTCVMSKPAVEAHGLREAFSTHQPVDALVNAERALILGARQHMTSSSR